jgi:predicted transcriptional regulator
MKKLSVLLLTLLFGVGSYAQQVNDPNAEIRVAKDFHGIHVSDAFDVFINQSEEEAVAVSAEEIKHRDRIKVEVKAGILYISYDAKGKLNWSNGNKKLNAYISFKEIDHVHVSGACDVFVEGILKADILSIHQSGASDFKGKLEVNKLTVDLSGASDIQVTGTARQISVEASGASKFKGYDLVTDICNVAASGASDIRITVNKELSAHASGASDVHYKGNCDIKEIKSSGSSSVSKG